MKTFYAEYVGSCPESIAKISGYRSKHGFILLSQCKRCSRFRGVHIRYGKKAIKCDNIFRKIYPPVRLFQCEICLTLFHSFYKAKRCEEYCLNEKMYLEKIEQKRRNEKILEELIYKRDKTSVRRKKYALYRLYQMGFYYPKTQNERMIIGEVFAEVCRKQRCVFEKYLSGKYE